MSSDDRLVELVVGGDDMAFELLYARHVADALAFANGLLGSREEAEQAVRHSFAAAHAYLAGGGREIAFEPWLYTILDNHCLAVLQQRRGVAEAPDGEVATVVDLEQWRHKRKLMGAASPVAPSAGFHDSVMTACGIGGGAATAAAPVLGGTLAKVAVVVLLAGGAGVAGNAASDRGGPVEAQVAQSPAAPTVSSGAASPAEGLVSRLSRPDRRTGGPELLAWLPQAGGGLFDFPSSATDDRAVLRTATPIGLTPYDGVVGSPSAAPIPAVAPTRLELPTADLPALSLPDRSVARRLGERLKRGLPRFGERLRRVHLPRLGARPKAGRPPATAPKLPSVAKPPKVDLPPVAVKPPNLNSPSVVEQPEVGDDADVPSVQSPIDLGPLLEQGLRLPPA
jgi:hypothetical protein